MKKLIILISFLLLFTSQAYANPFVMQMVGAGVAASGGGGDVEYVASPFVLTAEYGFSNNTVTIPSGATVALVSVTGFFSPWIVTAISLDSEAGTLVARTTNSSTSMNVEVYLFSGFETGSSKNLSATFADYTSDGANISVCFFSGVDLVDPVGDLETGGNGDIAAILDAAAGDMGIIVLSDYMDVPSVDSGTQVVQTSLYRNDAQAVGYKASTGSTVTMDGTADGTEGYGAYVAFILQKD